MILATEKKTIELSMRTRNVVRALDLVKKTDIQKAMFEGMNKLDMRMLSQIIVGLSDEKLSVSDVYDFIDDYRIENECSVRDIYISIIKELNDKYFFESKMSMDELEDAIHNPITVDMEAIVERVAQKMTEEVAMQSLTPLT